MLAWPTVFRTCGWTVMDTENICNISLVKLCRLDPGPGALKGFVCFTQSLRGRHSKVPQYKLQLSDSEQPTGHYVKPVVPNFVSRSETS